MINVLFLENQIYFNFVTTCASNMEGNVFFCGCVIFFVLKNYTTAYLGTKKTFYDN